MSLASRRALTFVALAAIVPLAILAACGSDNFSTSDQDAEIISPGGDGGFTDGATSTSDADAAVAPPTWCKTNAPNAFFCADFDEGDFTKGYYSGQLQTVFTMITIEDAGAIGEGDGGKSPPGTLHAIVPTINTGGVIEEAALVQTAQTNAPGATGFQFDFDLRNDASGVASSVGTTARIYLNDPTDGVTFAYFDIDLTSGGTSFDKTGTLSGLGAYPIFDLWTHYRIVVQLAGNVTVQINDGGVIDQGSSATKISTSRAQLTLGQRCDVSGGPPQCGQELSFDNIVIHALGLADGG